MYIMHQINDNPLLFLGLIWIIISFVDQAGGRFICLKSDYFIKIIRKKDRVIIRT